MLTAETSTVYFATIIFGNRIIMYDNPFFLIADNGGIKCIAKMFETFCLDLEVKLLTTTAYHLQKNGQVECYKKNLVLMLRHYILDHQKDWDAYVQRLPYANNMPVNRSPKTEIIGLVQTRQPHMLSDVVSHTSLPTEDYCINLPRILRLQVLPGVEDLKNNVAKLLSVDQICYNELFDNNFRTL